jgi:hypothetical protein
VVRQAFSETLVELETWFELPEESRSYRPQDGGWSIQAILEHITLTTHYLLLIIRQGQEKAVRRARRGVPVNEGESDLERLTPIGHPDAFPWIRPEHMEPTGASLEDVHTRLQTQYQECLTILAALGNGEGSLSTVRMSVQNLGKKDTILLTRSLNILLLIASHLLLCEISGLCGDKHTSSSFSG